MSQQISITLESNKLAIRCPMWANDMVTMMPARRWSKAKRAWMAPLTRMNGEYVRERLVKPGYASITAEAMGALDALEKSVEIAHAVGFPHWYKFKTEPRPHQIRAYNKLYGLNAMAFHADRGTGKSKMAIDIACAMRMEGKIDAVMVICRLSLRENWEGFDVGEDIGEREGFIGHSPIPVSCHLPDTSKVKNFERWLVKKHDFPVMIVGTESLSAGRMIEIAERFLTAHTKPLIIMDESHDIMSHNATRSERVVELGSKYSVARITLTGTPISTGPMNLFMQFEFLDPAIIGIGDYYAFRNRYAVMGGFVPKEGRMKGKPTQIVGYQNLDELTAAIAPYVFEISKEEALPHLPPKVYEQRYVELTPEQRALYRSIKKEEAYEWGGKETSIQNTLELELRLHQVAGGHIVTHREEIRRVKTTGENAIKRVAEWHRIVPPKDNPKIKEIVDIGGMDKQQIIWCAYRDEINMVVEELSDAYPKERIREFHGGVDEDDRNRFKKEFQHGSTKWLVGNTATGGAGHTLTACEVMVYYNNTNKMIDRLQSEDRAHRDGLKHSVLYIDLIARGTCDVVRMEANKAKMDLADFIRMRIREAQSVDDILGDG